MWVRFPPAAFQKILAVKTRIFLYEILENFTKYDILILYKKINKTIKNKVI